MARILITGGSSYLGQHLVPLALMGHETSYTYLSHNPLQDPSGFRLDVRDCTAVHALVTSLKPEAIIHTVGSNRPADMANVIIEGTQNVAKAARKSGARLIHISTDALFNGQNAPYTENDRPTPIHAYGRAKAEAETIAGRHPDHVIVRTSLIYGLQIMDQGTAWVVNALRKGQPVTLFTDQYRNPVWAQTLSLACLELATNDYQGVLNVAGEQILSRAEFGLRMLDWWGIEERLSLTLGPSDHARWPADCTLILDRARQVLNTPLPGVDEVLNSHLKNSL
jgi:dTDP-4-dehydrorhamnose reductase